MAMARSPTTSNLGGLHLPPRAASRSRIDVSRCLSQGSATKLAHGLWANQGMAQISIRGLSFKLHAKTSGEILPEAPKSKKPIAPTWLTSLLLSALSIVVPGWKTQLQILFKLEDQVDKVVEETTEAIEEIAEATEKVIEEMEHDLHADSKLTGAVLMIEHAAEKAEKDAKLARELMHKVDEIKEEIEEVVDLQ